MARCSGRLVWMCLMPCIMMGHLIIYLVVSITIAVSSNPPPQQQVRFVASGATTWSSPHPLGSFWNLRTGEGGLWNRLQHPQDRQHNPILLGNGTLGAEANQTGLGVSPSCRGGPDPQWAARLPDFDALPEQMRDFVLSMQCRDYPLLIDQPGVCSKEVGGANKTTPTLLLAVKSQMGNFENRQAIRETWGRSGWVEGRLVRLVFLLGRQDGSMGHHPDLGALLELEIRRHRDVLQWDFRDTFFNLTLKDVLFWRWFSTRCPSARFIFKGDDDVFLRTPVLLDFLRQRDGDRELVVGDVIANAYPIRQPTAKYYIPESFYQGGYPAYAGGGGVVYSGALAMRLARVSRRVQLFPIDDVYLGMCLHRLGLSPSHHPGFRTFDLPEEERDKPCAYASVLLVHRRGPQEMLKLWADLQGTPPPAC